MSGVLAFIGNIDSFELVLIAGVALLVFGKDLPRVIIRGLAHLTRLRRQLNDLWRQAGIEEELRKMRHEVEKDMPNPRSAWREELDRARAATAEIRREADPRAAIEGAMNPDDPAQEGQEAGLAGQAGDDDPGDFCGDEDPNAPYEDRDGMLDDRRELSEEYEEYAAEESAAKESEDRGAATCEDSSDDTSEDSPEDARPDAGEGSRSA